MDDSVSLTTVNTVLGSLDTAELGFTLSHEHVMVVSTPVQYAYPEFIRREETIRRGISELKEAYSEGLRTIVDVTPFDAGRDVEVMRQVSRGSGVQIVCATGCWLDIPRVLWGASPDVVASLFIRDITRGIGDTTAKAGIIKVATDLGGVTQEGEVILRAAARAQKATRVPISTHTWAPEKVGDKQIAIFEDEGVDLGRVYIGHSNDTTDIEYLTGLMKKGAWVGLDRYPGGENPRTPDWEGRTRTVKKLVDAGYGDRIMLGHDRDVTVTMANEAEQESYRRYNPDGYLFITRRVLPRLREMGVSEQTLDDIMVGNPRRFFEGRG
jgi:phosphotriesterase-related protein